MSEKVVATNKKAFHDFFIEEKLEAGMVLSGGEVKSLRAGKANLRDGYAQVKQGEVFLYNVHISPYAFDTLTKPDPMRPRKLLLHGREIRRLIGKIREKGFALVPLRIYFNKTGKAKLELGLARGKKQYDKRATIKQKDIDRDTEREMHKYRG